MPVQFFGSVIPFDERAPDIGARLNDLLSRAGLDLLDPPATARFEVYFFLLKRWNQRTNLTAIRDDEGILSRHFLESIACARVLPAGIQTLLDFGSGAGFPGIPIALCRPEISVTLAESQGKKAAFLQEALRTLDIAARVHAGRAELLSASFDCVTLRAVDRMEDAVQSASALVSRGGWLALMTSGAERENVESAAGAGFRFSNPIPLPGAADRILLLGASLNLPTS